MPTHEVRFKVDLNEEDEARIAAALRVGAADLTATLEQLAAAALDEWLDHALARRIPARVKDGRELRLLHYTLRVNGGQLPSPDQIAGLFHLTSAEARTLYRNTRTRYAFELTQGLVDALSVALSAGKWVEGSDAPGYVQIQLDDALVEYAEQQLVARTDKPPERIAKDDRYGMYRVPLSSLRVLCDATGLDFDTVINTAQTN